MIRYHHHKTPSIVPKISTMKHRFFLLFLFIGLQSCAVQLEGIELYREMQTYIYYLGENRTPTSDLDIYFDQFAVEKEYLVMGTLVNRETNEYKTVKNWKEAFIKRAKKVGGEGIIFEPLQMSFNPECEKCMLLNAKVIRYVAAAN